MRHHLDEFSVTDVRHTLDEAWRVVCHRRWSFIFPFCIASAIVLMCSLLVPRQYTARTVIKREHDPILANMMGSGWTRPYAELGKRMADDLRSEEEISEVLAELDLPPGLERFETGELAPNSQGIRRALAADISKRLSIQSLASSSNRDVVAIELALPDREHVPEILRTIRDRYMAGARRRTVAILRDAGQFFRAESERCRSELGALSQRLAEYELKYPGIDPDAPDPTRIEQTTLVVERVEVERRLDELRARRALLREKLEAVSGASDDEPLVEQEFEVLEPNPLYSELTREIGKVLREIADKKTVHGMTEQHPVVRQLRTTLAMRREELARTPRERRVLADSPQTAAAMLDGLSVATRLKTQAADVEGQLAAQGSRLGAIRERTARIERARAMLVEPRQHYLKLKEEAERVRSELQAYLQNIGPIQNIFTVEDRNRTIHFTTVQDVGVITKPSAPDGRLVTLVCLAIGAAVGVLFVLLSELIDRSYRTVKHLKSSLGLPVIESIDEIVTEAVRRKRLLRSFVLRPAAALVCVSAMVAAGAMAYWSIENPGRYESLRSAPLRAYRSVVG